MSSNNVIPGCGFHHVAVQTTDYEGTKRFYTEVLGFRKEHEWEMGERRLCLLDLGDGGYVEVVGIPASMVPEGKGQQFPMVHVAFRVADAAAAAERARAAGRPITVEPKDVMLGNKAVRVAFFLGPNEEVIELFQEK